MSETLDYRQIEGLSLFELMEKALDVKLAERGARFGLCTITNAKSGGCTEDCAFCAQSSRARGSAPLYGFKDMDTIVREAEEAARSGAERFSIVTSGKGPPPALIDKVAQCISRIKGEVDISVCASLGIMDEAGLKTLKDAGLSRYHHNLEASKGFFPRVCTTHTYEERVETIENARRAGLEVCAGGIIGLGEGEQDRFNLARELAGLQVDSCPINILVPISGTPLEAMETLSLVSILRTVAMFRLLLPWAAIRIAGGRERVLADAQIMAFMAGADSMLIGGYLTTRGRQVEMDLDMVSKVKELWKAHRR
ncbi:MAG: biotin synthase BioB [Thermodesulfobacteria bacterium]|nr:biotin synthase BioB [Thermodesulfobacteriota bacterium]